MVPPCEVLVDGGRPSLKTFLRAFAPCVMVVKDTSVPVATFDTVFVTNSMLVSNTVVV